MDAEKQKRFPEKSGRKSKIDVARFRFTVRLNEEENNLLNELIAKSGVKDKSKFVKHALFGKEIKITKVDKATMQYYMQLTAFYNQFQKIGNNYNQTLRAIKTNFGEKRAMALLYKLEKAMIQLVIMSKEIMRLTIEFEERWLQK